MCGVCLRVCILAVVWSGHVCTCVIVESVFAMLVRLC